MGVKALKEMARNTKVEQYAKLPRLTSCGHTLPVADATEATMTIAKAAGVDTLTLTLNPSLTLT